MFARDRTREDISALVRNDSECNVRVFENLR